MCACYYLLMNLAEDLSVEKKMLKKSLLESLVTHLRTAHSLQLLTVIVAFLKKLAIFEVCQSVSHSLTHSLAHSLTHSLTHSLLSTVI